MNKVIAILLPISWFAYNLSLESEYDWIFCATTACFIGYAIAYCWSFNDFRKVCAGSGLSSRTILVCADAPMSFQRGRSFNARGGVPDARGVAPG